MNLDPATLLAILVMALATAATRLGGVVLTRYVRISQPLTTALDAIPPAVLMAVIAPTAFATGWAETLATAVTALAALRLPMLVSVALGVATVAVARAVGL